MPKHIHGSIFPTSATAYPWLLWRVKKGRRWLVLEIPQCPPSIATSAEDYHLFHLERKENTSSQTLSSNIWVWLPQARGGSCLAEEFSLLEDIEDLPKKIIRHQVKRLQCLYSNLFGNILCILCLPQISSLKQCPPFISGHIPMAFFKIPSITR